MRIGILCGPLVGLSVAGVMLVSSMAPRAAAASAEPVTHTVTIDGTRFEPDDLVIKAGDSVVWVNHDPFPHTATATNALFDSKEILPDKSWTFTASAKGDIAYACTFHPTMKGTLHVQ
jgi:plastocyanin